MVVVEVDLAEADWVARVLVLVFGMASVALQALEFLLGLVVEVFAGLVDQAVAEAVAEAAVGVEAGLEAADSAAVVQPLGFEPQLPFDFVAAYSASPEHSSPYAEQGSDQLASVDYVPLVEPVALAVVPVAAAAAELLVVALAAHVEEQAAVPS